MTSPSLARTRPHSRIGTAIAAVALSGALVALATAVLIGLDAALSVATGAALATANLWLLARIVTSLLPDAGSGASRPPDARADATAPADRAARASAAWTVVVLLKMLALFGVVWLFMRHGVVLPLHMLVGFGALPIGIAIGSLVSDRSAHPEDP